MEELKVKESQKTELIYFDAPFHWAQYDAYSQIEPDDVQLKEDLATIVKNLNEYLQEQTKGSEDSYLGYFVTVQVLRSESKNGSYKIIADLVTLPRSYAEKMLSGFNVDPRGTLYTGSIVPPKGPNPPGPGILFTGTAFLRKVGFVGIAARLQADVLSNYQRMGG
jgi:hypothetical protein